MKMNRKKHILMTVSALFFLGLIVAKPDFYPKENDPCEGSNRDKIVCEMKLKLNQENTGIVYQVE